VSGRLGVVLVVDAHPETRRAALGALPPDEYRVLVVADARQALAVLGGERVDVLVSDLALPGDSGLHLLVEARRLHPAVVRVVLTAVAEFAAAVAAINEAEVFRFLGKPVDAAALRGAVDEALGRAEAVREVRGAKALAERRRVALVDLESDHAGISLVQLSPDGYFMPPQRLEGLMRRLQGTPVGQALAAAMAASRDATKG
jgi:DNA-binding NtrC family response regulator